MKGKDRSLYRDRRECGDRGRNCDSSFVHLDGWTIIGRNNIIKDHVSIGHAPQYLNYNNEKTYVVIGNNNNIGEFVTIHRGTADGIGETRVGHNNRIMSHCHIAHDCNLGNNIYMGSSTNLAGHVNIENDAWLEELVGVTSMSISVS